MRTAYPAVEYVERTDPREVANVALAMILVAFNRIRPDVTCRTVLGERLDRAEQRVKDLRRGIGAGADCARWFRAEALEIDTHGDLFGRKRGLVRDLFLAIAFMVETA